MLTAGHCNSLFHVNTQVESLCGQEQKFLIDTGASVSLISLETVKNKKDIETLTSNLRGIGGKQKILGRITLEIFGKPLKCYVIENLPIKVHGIFGTNFFTSFGAKIDYEKLTLTLIHED